MIVDMLEYVGVGPYDMDTVYSKIHYWDFVESLSTGYDKYGRLTEKQKEALKNLIRKHTGVECSDKLTHRAQYSREGSKSNGVREQVFHSFSELETIQLFDLPYESGEELSAEFHPYNKHSMVTKIAGTYYKMPKPAMWDEFTVPTTIKFTYRRTEAKGFLTKLQN